MIYILKIITAIIYVAVCFLIGGMFYLAYFERKHFKKGTRFLDTKFNLYEKIFT